MKNKHAKAISALSPENKKRFIKVVKNLETLAEATPVGDPIFFNPATYLGSDGYDERTIMAKLEEWGVLTAEPEELNYGLLVFTTLEKLHEVRSLLGGHASSSLDYVANIGMEEFYKDEIQLVNKLLQICNEKTDLVVLMRPAHLAMSHTDKAGLDHLEVLRDLRTQHKVFSSFKPSLSSIDLKHVAIIEARIDFTKLNERAESLHDDVESWKGVVLGKEQQKKELLRRLKEKFEKYPQEQYERSEKILGSYRPENPERPLGYSLFQPDKNRPDIRYRFMEAMRALEKEGHFDILDVQIDFFAEPQSTEQSLERHNWSLGERTLEYYPPEHCRVKLRLGKEAKSLPLPDDVDWKALEEKYILNFKDSRKLEFTNPEKPTAEYFRMLVENHGRQVKHQRVQQDIKGITKQQIKNLVKTLRKKVKNAGLSDRINFNTQLEGGYLLHITPTNKVHP